MEVGAPGGFAGFTGELLCRVSFLIKLKVSRLRLFWKGGSAADVSLVGFPHLWAAASVCSLYNLKSFICDIMPIYKLMKNILVNVICIKFIYKFVFVMFYFRVDLQIWLKVIKKFIIKQKKRSLKFI